MTGYTTMTIEQNGDLTFALTEQGREELAYQRKEYETKGDEAIFLDMIEDHLHNGLNAIDPEMIDAIAPSLLITDCPFDDDGNLSESATIWFYNWYQVRAYCDVLLNDGKITFTKASEA